MAAETSVSWQDYVTIILRRRWYFALPCLAMVVATLGVGLCLPRIYRAQTLILVQEPNIMNPLIQGLAVSTSVRERLSTLREELLGWTSLTRLVEELKLGHGLTRPFALEQFIKRLQRDIVVQMRGRDVIQISYEHPDPKLAQRLVNTISTIFLERNVAAEEAETDTAISFLEHELQVYAKKLEGSERALREFRELYGAQMPVAMQLNDQIIRLQVTLANLLIENTEEHPEVVEARRRIDDLTAQRNTEIKQFVASALAHGEDPQRYQTLLAALEQPSRAQEDGAARDPQVRRVRQAYAAWLEQMDNPMPAAQPSAPRVQVVAEGGVSASSVEVAGAGPTAFSLAPWQEQELQRLTRDYQVHASTYQHLQERLERATITQRLGESNEGLKFQILEPARLPLRPVKPHLGKLFLLAWLLGACAGVGVAFVAEYLDHSFQSAEEVQAALAVPVLGSIATITTQQDLEQRRARLKGWLSVRRHLATVREDLLQPLRRLLGQRLDALLVRWKL